MTAGWVALEWKGRESLVPAGANCRTKSGAGSAAEPGTPYFSDASEALQQALAAFDFEKGGSEALRVILRRIARPGHADAMASAFTSGSR